MTVDNKLKYSDSVYMQNVKSKARQKVHYVFENFWDIGKSESYDRIFFEYHKGRISIKEICIIAEGFGVPSWVIEMRKRDFAGMSGGADIYRQEHLKKGNNG